MYGVEDEARDEGEYDLFLAQLFVGTMNDSQEGTTTLAIGSHPIMFKLDTGASANVMPLKTYQTAFKALPRIRAAKCEFHPTRNILTGIGNGKIKPIGQTNLPFTRSDQDQTQERTLAFYITDYELAILGREACEQLDLLRRVNSVTTSAPSAYNVQDKRDLMRTYADVFTGIGECERQCHIRLQSNASPVIQDIPLRQGRKTEGNFGATGEKTNHCKCGQADGLGEQPCSNGKEEWQH